MRHLNPKLQLKDMIRQHQIGRLTRLAFIPLLLSFLIPCQQLTCSLTFWGPEGNMIFQVRFHVHWWEGISFSFCMRYHFYTLLVLFVRLIIISSHKSFNKINQSHFFVLFLLQFYIYCSFIFYVTIFLDVIHFDCMF